MASLKEASWRAALLSVSSVLTHDSGLQYAASSDAPGLFFPVPRSLACGELSWSCLPCVSCLASYIVFSDSLFVSLWRTVLAPSPVRHILSGVPYFSGPVLVSLRRTALLVLSPVRHVVVYVVFYSSSRPVEVCVRDRCAPNMATHETSAPQELI